MLSGFLRILAILCLGWREWEKDCRCYGYLKRNKRLLVAFWILFVLSMWCSLIEWVVY